MANVRLETRRRFAAAFSEPVERWRELLVARKTSIIAVHSIRLRPSSLVTSTTLNNDLEPALRLPMLLLHLGLLLGRERVLGVLGVPVLGEVFVVREGKHACAVKPKSAPRSLNASPSSPSFPGPSGLVQQLV